jgi:hypothetical protein
MESFLSSTPVSGSEMTFSKKTTAPTRQRQAATCTTHEDARMCGPDLSQIEQVWADLKRMIAGTRFKDTDGLFNALSRLWNDIPNDSIAHSVSSFQVRCAVCASWRNLPERTLGGSPQSERRESVIFLIG